MKSPGAVDSPSGAKPQRIIVALNTEKKARVKQPKRGKNPSSYLTVIERDDIIDHPRL
jgi:hypothetical protein